MYILEVAAQNVRGFSPTVRAALKPGYNIVKPPSNTLPPIGQVAIALCFADGRGSDAAFLAQGATAGKAGLTLFGNDSATYRLLRQLGGAGALHKLNAQTQKFELVSEDAAEIGQFLRSQVGLPSRGAFEQLFCLTAAQLPSRRPKKAPAPAKAPEAPQRTISRDNIPVMAADDVGSAEKRLIELNAELKTARETADIQFQFDGTVSEIYDIERKLKMLEELKEQAAEAEKSWKNAPTAQSLGLPADLIRRAESYHDAVAKRDAELAKLKDANEEDLEPFPWEKGPKKVIPVWMEPNFWYGVGAGVVALVAGALLSGWLKYVALLDIPAFGFAGILALQWVEELQKQNFDTRRGGRKANREAKIKEDFEAAALAVEKAMQLLDVEKPEEVIARLREKDSSLQAFNQLRAKVETFEADPDYQAKVARLPEVKAENERLNQELVARGGYMREPREIEKDIDRLKLSIQLAKSGQASSAPQPTGAPAAAGAATAGVEDPSPAILKIVADLLQGDVPTAIAAVRDRALQYFAALTDKRYQAIEFDLEGKGFAHAAGNRISVSDLPPKDADLFALSLRLTAVEKTAAKQKIPVFIEDGLACVDEAKLPLVARMLKHLGTMTQVIQASGHPGFQGMADQTVNI